MNFFYTSDGKGILLTSPSQLITSYFEHKSTSLHLKLKPTSNCLSFLTFKHLSQGNFSISSSSNARFTHRIPYIVHVAIAIDVNILAIRKGKEPIICNPYGFVPGGLGLIGTYSTCSCKQHKHRTIQANRPKKSKCVVWRYVQGSCDIDRQVTQNGRQGTNLGCSNRKNSGAWVARQVLCRQSLSFPDTECGEKNGRK